MSKSEANEVVQRQRIRDQVMVEVYRKSGGQPNCGVNMDEIAKKLGLGREGIRSPHTYLLEAGLVEGQGPRTVAMRVEGIRYVEKLTLKRKDQQFKLLREFYRMAHGDVGHKLHIGVFDGLEASAGVPEKDAKLAWEQLCDDGLLEVFEDDIWALTTEGVKNVKDAVAHPNHDTEHFPASIVTHNTISYHIAGDVAALQSGSGNIAHIVQQSDATADVLRLIGQLRHGVAQLPSEKREEAGVLVDAIEEEVKQPSKKSVALVKSHTSMLNQYMMAYGPTLAAIVDYLIGLAK